MKKLFISVLALAGLAACYNENVVSESSSLAPITFGDVFVEKATRADDPSTTTNNINGFYVWAVMDSQDGTVFADEYIYRGSEGWTYDHPATWAPGHDYYFSALAAKREKDAPEFTNLTIDFASDINGMSTEGLGTVTFTNTDGTDDILYAECERETANPMTSAPEAVKFQFHHLLSKIKFTFINGFENENDTVVVTNVKIEVPEVGSIDLTQDSYTWTPGTEKLALVMGDVKNGDNLKINESVSTNERFTIPASAGMTYKVTFDVETFAGSVSRTKATKTIELKGYEFGVGNAYNLVATINKDNADENPMYDIVFDVVVDEWAEQENEELTFYDPETNTANINSIKDLEYINESIYNQTIPSDIKIFLSNDIDLNYYNITRSGEPTTNWTPIGTSEKPFKGTFDGNGHTIKNLTLVETEAKEGKAYIGFFGFAKNATIKNVTFENVYINIPCLDIDHSQGHIGAVAGSLEGTSTIENVTVKGDIKVYATQNANGASRVAVVAGGNSNGNVTMRNVHVIANEDSYLIANNNTGALAGQLQGKALFENCSSNIDVTVNKFFAGGLIGIAAGDQTFINCHTTGDVAVVAGREGRHNDEYRVGGIAGGWADNTSTPCVLTNCSYTGKVSGKNSDGAVAEPLDYMGYVGRGYTLNGCQGSKVIINGIEFVQKYNTAAEAGIYEVSGANGETVVMISTADELNKLNAKNAIVLLNADIDFQGAAMTKPIELWGNSTFNGNGHKIMNVKTAVQGGYATSLFRGDANTGNKVVKNLVVENLTTPSGYSFAAAIWSDLQGANIEIDNVHINNSTIEAAGTVGGFVGFVSGSTTNVTIKNSSINNTNLNGGEADHKRGAVVGRAYGCAATCSNVVVNNVKINGVAATSSTLVGDKGYTGDITVK